MLAVSAHFHAPFTLADAHGTIITPRAHLWSPRRKLPTQLTLFDLLTTYITDLDLGEFETCLLQCGALRMYQAVQLMRDFGAKNHDTVVHINKAFATLSCSLGMTLDRDLIAALEAWVASAPVRRPMTPDEVSAEEVRLAARKKELEAELLVVHAEQAALSTAPVTRIPECADAYYAMRVRVQG